MQILQIVNETKVYDPDAVLQGLVLHVEQLEPETIFSINSRFTQELPLL